MTNPEQSAAVAQVDRIPLEQVTPTIAAAFADTPCAIWSGEHGSWWSAEGRGYTRVRERAGRYTIGQAYEHARHCGPEKQIAFERLTASTEAERAVREAVKIAVADASYHLKKYRPHVLEALQAALALPSDTPAAAGVGS